MSRYTTQLRFPIEQKLTDLKLSNTEENWPQAYQILGLQDYPIFDETYRSTLNNKIIRSYYFREIGFETLGQFAWQMRRTMFEIMPYYNQLYKSELLDIDPFKTKDMNYDETWTRDEKIDRKGSEDSTEKTDKTDKNIQTTDTKQTTDSEQNTSTKQVTDSTTKLDEDGTSSTSSTDRNVVQDTPMNGLDTGAIKNMDYATNVTYDDGSTSGKTTNDATTKVDSTVTNKGTVTNNGIVKDTGTVAVDDTVKSTSTLDKDTTDKETGDYDGTKHHREYGFDGNMSELLLTYRKTFLNIDLEIIRELNILFMGLW